VAPSRACSRSIASLCFVPTELTRREAPNGETQAASRPIVQRVVQTHPDLAEIETAIRSGHVLVDGRHVTNIHARVANDASIKIRRPLPLRGSRKLGVALERFGLDVRDRIALDLGASAGGFTAALLDHGARHVYAVDVGYGQLRGRLRADPRVHALERTNIAVLTRSLIPETVDIITIDLSYLALSVAVPSLEPLAIAATADLVALVKPMYELRLATSPPDQPQLRPALDQAIHAVEASPWTVADTITSPITGRRGNAIEFFIHARRRAAPRGRLRA